MRLSWFLLAVKYILEWKNMMNRISLLVLLPLTALVAGLSLPPFTINMTQAEHYSKIGI